VDRFKAINDTFGHRCGDIALQEIGKTLMSCIRSSDSLGRWGGDEFVGIVRGVDADELRVIADRCVALVNRSEVLGVDQRRIPVSVSVGAALIGDLESPEELFARTDELMYQSKWSGRSCASLAAVG
jgi:diguanylate cyclase (GGDEF)-like protein